MSVLSFIKNSSQNPSYFSRRLMWKYYELTNEKEITLQTDHGVISFSSKDGYIGRNLFLYRNYHYNWIENIVEFLRKELIGTENPVMFNIGANIGLNCIPYGVENLFSTIYAMEPYLKNFEFLKSNIINNNLLDMCVIESLAVGDEDSHKYLTIDPDNYGNCEVVTVQSEGAVPIETKTLDNYVIENNIDFAKIKFISMDVQGFELNVLKGAKEILLKSKPILVMEVDSYFKSKWDLIMPVLNNYYEECIPVDNLNVKVKVSDLKDYTADMSGYMDFIFLPK